MLVTPLIHIVLTILVGVFALFCIVYLFVSSKGQKLLHRIPDTAFFDAVVKIMVVVLMLCAAGVTYGFYYNHNRIYVINPDGLVEFRLYGTNLSFSQRENGRDISVNVPRFNDNCIVVNFSGKEAFINELNYSTLGISHPQLAGIISAKAGEPRKIAIADDSILITTISKIDFFGPVQPPDTTSIKLPKGHRIGAASKYWLQYK